VSAGSPPGQANPSSPAVPDAAAAPSPDDIRRGERIIRIYGWRRDCGAAIALGGGTVALSLPLGNIALHRPGYIALLVLFSIVLGAATVLELLALRIVSATSRRSIVVSTCAVLVVADLLGYSAINHWPVHPGSVAWSVAIGFGVTTAILGVIIRRQADELLVVVTPLVTDARDALSIVEAAVIR
jgi:hypothetical protein